MHFESYGLGQGAIVGDSQEQVFEKSMTSMVMPLTVQSVNIYDDIPETLLRAGDRSPTNPKLYELVEKDAGSGLSTFDKANVDFNDIYSAFPRKDRIIEIPTGELPDGIVPVKRPGTTNNPILDNNHWELRDTNKISKWEWHEYRSWWNDKIVPRLTQLAQKWKVTKRK